MRYDEQNFHSYVQFKNMLFGAALLRNVGYTATDKSIIVLLVFICVISDFELTVIILSCSLIAGDLSPSNSVPKLTLYRPSMGQHSDIDPVIVLLSDLSR